MQFHEAWAAIQPIRGWLGNINQARFMWEAAQLGKNVIEIGTYCGKSAVLMALAMKACGSCAKVHCVDTFKATNVELVDEDTFDEFIGNAQRLDVGRWIEPHIGNSRDPDVIMEVPNGAQMVYIDAGHEYDQVYGDIASWQGHVDKGGVLLFHDFYDQPGEFPDVRRAVEVASRTGLIGTIHRIRPDAAYCRRPNCCKRRWK